jgi:hypothetical protein
MKQLVLAFSIAAALVLANTSAPAPTPALPSLNSAGPFLIAEIQDKLDGRWDRAWSGLAALHQRVAPRQVYVRCERSTPFLAQTLRLGVVSARRALVRVPGLTRRMPGAAVKLRVALSWYGPRDPIVITPTLHLVALDGKWRWLLSQQRYRLYQRGKCGSLPPV